MYLYNTTFAIDTAIEAEVIMWLKDRFIPEALEDGYFINEAPSGDIFRVLGGEPGVTSIAVHLYCDSIENIKDWYADRGSGLFSYILERWNQRVMFFSTTLECLCR